MARWGQTQTCQLVVTLSILLNLYGTVLASDLSFKKDSQIQDYLLKDLLYGADDSDYINREVKRLNPNSFGFSRGRRTNEFSDFEKRLNAASFSFTRGKKSYSSLDDDMVYGPPRGMFTFHGKRVPPSGFAGMRGKRSNYFDTESDIYDDMSAVKRQPPQGYVVVRGKRLPPSGFSGLRGKKSPPSGFSGLRGRKRAPPSGFSGLRGRKRAPPSGFQGLRGKKRTPPSGFSGLRGKKSLNHALLESLSKRGPPEGFLGLRGKKAYAPGPYDTEKLQMDPFQQDLSDVSSYSSGLTPENELEYYMQELNFLRQLRTSQTPPVASSTVKADRIGSNWDLQDPIP